MSRRGAGQRRTRPVKPRKPAKHKLRLMCPCGNRPMSGCPHNCQSSSMGSLGVTKSWVPSTNNILSLGIAGRAVVRLNGVISSFSSAARTSCHASRTPRQMICSAYEGLLRTVGWVSLRTTQPRASVGSLARSLRHFLRPCFPPSESLRLPSPTPNRS